MTSRYVMTSCQFFAFRIFRDISHLDEGEAGVLDFAGGEVGDVHLCVDPLPRHAPGPGQTERPGHFTRPAARGPEHRVLLLLSTILQEGKGWRYRR